MKIDFKWLVLFGLILAATLIFYRSGDFALADPDEARYAETSREMIEQRSYIVPLHNYEPRLSKPVLFYWCQIASFKLFGVNEFAARFPSALAGLATIILVYMIGKLLFNREIALLSVFICITSIFFLTFAKAGILEILLLFTFALSIYFFLMAEISFLNLNGEKKGLYISLFFASLGLSFMVKGPVGVLVPIFIVGIYLIFMRRVFPFSIKNFVSGIILFFCIISPWGLALIGKIGLPKILAILKKETVERYFLGLDHLESFYFYVPILLVGFFPWSSFVPAAVWRIGKAYFKNKNNRKLFLIIWFIFPLIFFSFSVSKLPGYILPILPAASLIVASEWYEEKRKSQRENQGQAKKIRSWFFMTGYIILLIFYIIFWIIGFLNIDKYPEYKAFYYSISLLGALLIVISFIFMVRKKHFFFFSSIVIFFIFFSIFCILFFMPHLENRRSTKKLVFDRLVDYPDRIFCTYNQRIPSLVFYLKQKVELIWGEEELMNMLQSGQRKLVVMSEKNYKTLSSQVKRQVKIEEKTDRFILIGLLEADQPKIGDI